MSAALIAGLFLVLAAGVTAAGSVIVARTSQRQAVKADVRDDLLIATLGRLDTSMLQMAQAVGALEADSRTVKHELAEAKQIAHQDLQAAKQDVVDALHEHTEQDNRGWRWLGVPESALAAPQ